VVAEVMKDCSGFTFGFRQSNYYVSRLWSLIIQQKTRRHVTGHSNGHSVTGLRDSSVTELCRKSRNQARMWNGLSSN